MQHCAKSTNNPEAKWSSCNPYTARSQPWWLGIGHDGVSQVVLGESMENISSPREPINGGLGTKTSKSQVKGGMDGGTNANKDTLITEVPQAGGKFGEHQLPQLSASIMHPTSREYLTPSRLMELVGHSIACALYPFSDSCYEGAVPTYGPQALVHSDCIGVHSARMALPLEMTEEPVYVNAKQYHRILRRRQLRAKAELEKKLIKVRKPYLHESRHLHAMRRARGCGGRFLNTKKLDGQASNANPIHGASFSVPVSTQASNSSSSESVPTHYSRSVDSSTGHREVVEPQVHEMQPQQWYFNSNGKTYLDFNDNSNGLFSHHQEFQLFKYHSLLDNKVEAGDFSGRQSERTVANRAQHKAVTIK